MRNQALSPRFHPRPVTITSSLPKQLIEDALEALRHKAISDASACYGYFPSMLGAAGIDHDLPASRRLAESMPVVEIDGRSLHFNFVRLSLVKQLGTSPFHLDSDANTALTGSIATLRHRLVSRLLLNLSSTKSTHAVFLECRSFLHPIGRQGRVRLLPRTGSGYGRGNSNSCPA